MLWGECWCWLNSGVVPVAERMAAASGTIWSSAETVAPHGGTTTLRVLPNVARSHIAATPHDLGASAALDPATRPYLLTISPTDDPTPYSAVTHTCAHPAFE